MPHLLSPLAFAGLTLRNRIVMPPMWSGKATAGGFATDANVEYHRVRAEAGTALVIVEHAFVSLQGRHSATQLGAHDDACIEGLSRVAAAIRSAGAAACLQISHAGSRSSSDVTGMPVVAPSPIRNPRQPHGEVPAEMTPAQIADMTDAFAASARRAQQAGFDAVEIHAAHGFLLSQFLSPVTNQRGDEYGRDHDGRSRLHLEVLAAVRARVGTSFPVFVRLGAHDERPDGLQLGPACYTAARLAANGAALIDVSGGFAGSEDPGRGPGYFVPYAQAMKEVVDVPVLVAGGITDPQMADVIVRSGRADLIGIGRAMLDDPQWAAKAIAALSGAG